MFRFRRAPLMWALFALLWVGSSAAAQEKKLFAVDGASNNPATLYELDRTDGSIIETIGAIGFDHVTAIDFDPTTGVLYGIANGPTSFGPATLITIDLTFGIGTFVADISWDTPPSRLARTSQTCRLTPAAPCMSGASHSPVTTSTRWTR